MNPRNQRREQNLRPLSESIRDHQWFMKLAVEQADLAWKKGEVPVGALVVSSKGEILSATHNLKESVHNPCGHAEILAIQDAAQKNQDWRLINCTLYVTLEPCPMCLSAISHARISEVVFGAYDSKGGALSLGYHFHKDARLNHRFSMLGGVEHYSCSKLLSDFFKTRRPAKSNASHNS